MNLRCAVLTAAILLAASPSAAAGSENCRPCHAAIYKTYEATPMARSATALDGSSPRESFGNASFENAPSGFHYRVSLKGNVYSLAFGRSGGAQATKTLAYAVGSGARAISYLLNEDGFLFEAPAAFYTLGSRWGLPPGYNGYAYPYLSRPIVPACLSCHASFLNVEPGTLNRYRSPAFVEGGVACERCHGDGARHVAKMRSAKPAGDPLIVNPARLAPDKRDSVCSQCHLTGDVRVMRRGMDWRSYRPGESLAGVEAVFVRVGKPAEMTVTGHVENLSASACKRASGDRLWCGSCHNPHQAPAPAEAAAWYRARCLTCHTDRACTESAAARAKAKDDCAGCHMPKIPAIDAEHTVFTDHSIPRRPRRPASRPPDEAELTPFGGAASPRDFALAYAIAAIGKTSGADRARAQNLLERAAAEDTGDIEVTVSLAEIYRTQGKTAQALPLYRRAIALDPTQVTALVGLGAAMMERGAFADAARFWTDALARNAGLELVRLNLALALLKTGDRGAAKTQYQKVWRLNPAFIPPRELARQLADAGLRQ